MSLSYKHNDLKNHLATRYLYKLSSQSFNNDRGWTLYEAVFLTSLHRLPSHTEVESCRWRASPLSGDRCQWTRVWEGHAHQWLSRESTFLKRNSKERLPKHKDQWITRLKTIEPSITALTPTENDEKALLDIDLILHVPTSNRTNTSMQSWITVNLERLVAMVTLATKSHKHLELHHPAD